MSRVSPTRGVDLLLVAYAALTDDEQSELYERVTEQRTLSQATDDSEMARCVRSLYRVAEYVGREPSVDDYRIASAELIAAGEDIEPFKRLYAFFGNTWRNAREAFALAKTTTPGRIEARFEARRIGKVARYSEETLRETLLRCAAEYGCPPRVNQFEWWRHRELELARAAGNTNLQLPSATPYRRRWGTWEVALRHFGFSETELDGRLEL